MVPAFSIQIYSYLAILLYSIVFIPNGIYSKTCLTKDWVGKNDNLEINQEVCENNRVEQNVAFAACTVYKTT